jgi:heme-degrading monooxygenase HmoA
MIVRNWHGRVPANKADTYHAYLLRTGIADYRATPGNRGVYVMRRIEEQVAHFEILTFWDSVEAIKAFAGDDYELARYYPEDGEFLLEREPYVRHLEVLYASPELEAATV